MIRLLPKAIRLAATVALVLPTIAGAQSLNLPGEVLPEQQQQCEQGQRGQQQGQQNEQAQGSDPRADWRTGTYGPVNQGRVDETNEGLPPFGANLFEGGFRGTRADGLNPSYTIKPGEEITLRTWGAVEISSVMPVDAQGNMFIPGIGPVQVRGANSAELNDRVRGAINKVYPENVGVYTNLRGVQPIGVFITGYIENPGRYAGTPSDSLLYFLDQAGGIDQALGSYRSIRLMRDGEILDRFDLYDFLLEGNLPRPQFRDGDTIVVEERGPAIALGGAKRRSQAD